jgi:membrane protein
VEELKAQEPAARRRRAWIWPRPSGVAVRHRSFKRAHVLLWRTVHRTVLSVLAHDCLNLAQSTAYSAIVALFPALIVAAAVIGLLPDTAPVRFQLASFFDRILPPGVSPLLDAYFQTTPSNTHSLRALVVAGFVSFLGASNVMATLMEGLRRARRLPEGCWNFWQKRMRSFELVFLSLVPLTVASMLVVFGHAVTLWLTPGIDRDARETIYAIAVLVRWTVALGASVGVTALVYRLGIPQAVAAAAGQPAPTPLRRASDHDGLLAAQTWTPTLPGAVVATAMWFLTTLVFGWYVTRFANYSEVYGSLGAGIALLFWLYIISLSVLCGAEFNAHFDAHFGSASEPPAATTSRS